MRYLVALFLTGCAPFVAFSVMGPDTYAVETGQVFVGRQQAGAYCTNMGKYVLITNTEQREWGATTVFRCLAAGDRDLQRPVYQQPPTAVIQDNRSR